MKVMKNEKGITLVALIITIIVMLILVGVTINLAVNSGLFELAREGTQKTKERIVHEEIIASLNIDDNGDINVYATYNDVKELMANENKSLELQTPAEETDVVEGIDSITIKVLDLYTYDITKEGIVNNNE